MPDIGGAVVNGDFVLVKQLLDDISTGSKKSINEIVDGSSLLHLAIGTKQTHITSLLLRNGADPDLMDTFGYAPIHLAVLAAEQSAKRRRRQRAKQVVEASDKDQKAEDREEVKGEGEAVKPMVREPLEVQDFGLLTLLLHAGADVDQPRVIVSQNQTAGSPLFEAVCQGEVELVRCLLEFGADANVAAHARDSPYSEPALHVAARTTCPGQVEICNLLLQHGADPTAVAGGATGGVGGSGGDDDDDVSLDDSIVVYEMVDATAHASSGWIKSLIEGLQLAENARKLQEAKDQADAKLYEAAEAERIQKRRLASKADKSANKKK